MVNDTYKQDRKTPAELYYLTCVVGGYYRIVHDSFGSIPKFRTIKEAQSYASSIANNMNVYSDLLY